MGRGRYCAAATGLLPRERTGALLQCLTRYRGHCGPVYKVMRSKYQIRMSISKNSRAADGALPIEHIIDDGICHRAAGSCTATPDARAAPGSAHPLHEAHATVGLAGRCRLWRRGRRGRRLSDGRRLLVGLLVGLLIGLLRVGISWGRRAIAGSCVASWRRRTGRGVALCVAWRWVTRRGAVCFLLLLCSHGLQ